MLNQERGRKCLIKFLSIIDHQLTSFNGTLGFFSVAHDPSIKAVIWDSGGVIVRTEDDSRRRAWEQKLGLSLYELDRIVLGSESWVQAQRGNILEEQYWTEVRGQLNLDERTIWDIRRDFYAEDRVNPVVIDVITRLRPRYKQAVLSNAVPSLIETLRDRFRVAHLFDLIITSASIGVMKPAPQAYQAALDALALQAEETVFIDDLLENIKGAEKLGMRTIHFETKDYDVRPQLSTFLGGIEL